MIHARDIGETKAGNHAFEEKLPPHTSLEKVTLFRRLDEVVVVEAVLDVLVEARALAPPRGRLPRFRGGGPRLRSRLYSWLYALSGTKW